MEDWQQGILFIIIGFTLILIFWKEMKKRNKNASEWIKISLSYDLIGMLLAGLIFLFSGIYKVFVNLL